MRSGTAPAPQPWLALSCGQDFLLYTSPYAGHSASKGRIGVCSTGFSGPNSSIRHKMICNQRVTLFENIYSIKRRDDRQLILQ